MKSKVTKRGYMGVLCGSFHSVDIWEFFGLIWCATVVLFVSLSLFYIDISPHLHVY